jgi:hypothetical protein
MKTYNVILHKGVDYQSFWDDMENENDGGKLYIPNRRVDSPNLRPNSPRQTWYTLSDEEAETVRNDERVLAVEIPPEFRDDIIIAPRITQTGNFTKTTSDSGDFLNWGLIRSSFKTNIYGGSSSTSENYLYTVDGTNVDVVIQDSGLQSDHPEFTDSNGLSRVVDINWFTESGVSGTQSSNHNRDTDGHGTHCGGIAVGKSYGWAKNANIYSQKIAGLEGTGDSGTGISPSVAFDCIKGWHNSKAINVDTGVKNPTVVNMSWGYLTTYTDASIDEINYRGTSYTGTQIDSTSERENNYGLMYSLYSVSGPTYMTNTRIVSVDTDIEELLEAGVHVCVAAGNRSHKIDEFGGDDYDNYFGEGVDTPQYYHRGSSPYGDSSQDGTGTRAIIVGNMDSTSASATNDQKAISSECGPGVDIYAPGTNIMSCTSTTNKWGSGSQNYYLNSSYRQTNISGTSMASPQVVGVLALYLQVNPSATPAQAKEWLLSNAGTAILNTGSGNDWTNDRSLKGGAAKVLFNKFNKAEPIKFENVSSDFITNGLTLTMK